MHRRFFSVAVAICALTACKPRTGVAPGPGLETPSPVPVAPPVTAPVTRPGSDVIRLGPSALRYVVHHQIHIEQQYPGQTQVADRGLRVFLSATIVGPADSAGYPVTFTIDSIAPDSGTAFPANVSLPSARGLRYYGHLTPTGEFRQAGASDSTVAQVFTQIIGAFRNFYPRVPPGGLTLGADWTDSSSTNDRVGIDVNIKAIARSRATTWEQRNGTRCLRVESTATYSVVGSGEQMGQPIEVSGTGTRAGVQFVAIDGRYLGGEAHDSSALVVGLPMQGMTIPVRQLSHSTFTVLP